MIDLMDIVLTTEEDALAVREAMLKLQAQYEVVTLADYLELVGLQPSFTDTKIGWTELNDVKINSLKGGFVLFLPEPKLIGPQVAPKADYSRTFDAHNKNWSNSPENSRMFLQTQQNWTNDILQARGHVFLNDVYDALGFPRTREGQLVGWLRGDGVYIDFGITEVEQVHFKQPAFALNFNVQGVVYDKI